MSMSKFVTCRVSPTLSTLARVLRAQSNVPLESTTTTAAENVDVRPFKDIPGPKGPPYIGSIHRYFKTGGFSKMHEVHQAFFNEFGPIFKETIFGRTAVHVLDPDEIAKLFRSEGKFPKRPVVQSFRKIAVEGGLHSMAVSDGPEWKMLRKPVQSKMMRPKELYRNIENFNKVVDDALESIRRSRGHGTSEGEVSNLSYELKKWAMESIGVLVFDDKIGLFEDPPSKGALESIQAIQEIFTAMHNLEFGPERMFFEYFDTPSMKVFKKKYGFSREYAMKFVKKRMDELKEGLENPEKLLQMEGQPLLSFLLAKGDLSLNEIADSCVDMFLGGVDTTSILLTWALYRLATNQDVQECLYHEMIQVAGKDGQLTSNDMGRIPYLKAVLKEVSRLDGIAPTNVRILDKDIALSGYNIPAGVWISPNIYSTVRSEKYFKDAEAFKPERWLRESGEEHHAFASLPFGFGPRMCIGKRTAELEVILFLSKVVRKFKLEYNQKPLQKVLSLTLRPDEDNVKIYFADRK